MTTKEQERKALEQIVKIVESLGEDSYIATAMQGMVEDARENIENDFALSWKDRAQTAEQACDLRREQAHKLEEENKRLKNHLGCVNGDFDKLQDLHDQLMKDFDQLRIEKFEAENRAGVAESKIVDLKEEIVHLKAKLYDMMTKEG